METTKRTHNLSSGKSAKLPIRKFLDLHELEEMGKGPVYVINVTRDTTRGPVMFGVVNPDGRGSTICVIPATFLAVDLTEQVSRDALMKSTDFRRAVTYQQIQIVTAEEAQRRNQQDGADLERERIRRIMQDDRAEQAGVLEKDVEQEEILRKARAAAGLQEVVPNPNRAETAKVSSESDGVRVTLRAMFETDELKDKSADEIINSLRSMEDLTEIELTYVITKARELDQTKVVKYARKRRDEMEE